MTARKRTTAGTKRKAAKAAVNGADAIENGVESAMQNYNQIAELGKENFDAFMDSANIATKGFEKINQEAVAFSKQSIEEGVAMAKSAINARTVQDLFEIQSDYTKQAFDAYLGQMNRFADVLADTAKEAGEPINARFKVWVGLAQNLR